jgi:prepilin-type N-terminal cleavage/methylation domain-containing protein
MLKSKTSKGFTLIEVMAAITLFSTLFLATMTIQISYMRLKLHNEKMNNYRFIMEIIKYGLLYDISRDELLELKNNNRIYLNGRYINSEILRNEDLIDLFSDRVESEELYIKTIIEGEEVFKIELQFIVKLFGNQETIICEFYRGFY